MKNRKQKILYLITKSNYGGAQKYTLELASKAKEAGYEVAVACGGTGLPDAPAGKLINKLLEHDIKVFLIKNFVRNMSLHKDFLAFFEVWRLVRKERPDVLHVTSSKAGGIGAFAGKLVGVRNIVFTSHGLTIDETWRPVWQRALIYLGTWLTIWLADKSIMVSTDTFERARKMPYLSNRIHLIKTGIEPVTFQEKAKARTLLAPFVPQKDFWIGGIGELHTNKNWAVAIEAMISLPDKCHLIIVGEGEERQKLEQLIKEKSLGKRVHLLGFIEAAPCLKALDIFLLPSLKEGLPYVLLEAGLAELPVIASDLPGNRDIIETGKNGFLIEPTPKLIATVTEMLLRDEAMRRNLGQNLNHSIAERFSIKKMAKETFSLYSSKNRGV